MGTWIVGAVLLALVVLTVSYMVRQRRKSRENGECVSGCAGCPYAKHQR